nr:MAG TPA: cysteine-rich protein [Caudoviricetes sp.]
MQYTYSWQKCPICGNPKMFKTRDDTQAKNFPCFCKRCKQESIITIVPKSRIMNS